MTDKSLPAGQFALLKDKRFYPLFGAQFGGAFNDNFYKSALLMLFTYGDIARWGLDINVLNNLVAAALIIPFLLFAPSAGQHADRFEKARFIRTLKRVEIALMLLGALALWLNSSALLLLVIFATGTQSACFSPLKYAVLPQHLNSRELTGANGMMHTGTSLAIFLGLIAGSVALQFSHGRLLVAVGGLLVAWLGWRFSCRIPSAAPEVNAPRAERNPLRQTWRTLTYARDNNVVFWSILGVSWYWFLGSVYLTQLPNFARSVLTGSAASVPCLLTLFLLGICAGALLCERLSRRVVEPALMPLGALLVALAGFDLAFAGSAFTREYGVSAQPLLTLSDLLQRPEFYRVAMDVCLLGAAGALYMVPLQALMQARAEPAHRAQIIAANNVINALFMIAAALFGALLLGFMHFTIPHFFMLTSVLHCFIITVILLRQPLFVRRIGHWLRGSENL